MMDWVRRSPRVRQALEASAILFVLIAGYRIGLANIRDYVAAGHRPFFYQWEFGPAVSMACGYGFQNIDAYAVPTLEGFLSQRLDAFDCEALDRTPAFISATQFHRISRYLETAVAVVWRIDGIAWGRLVPLFAVLYAMSCVLLYGLFRLGGGPVAALGGTALVALSPLHLQLLSQLRDYAKAPFVLALLLLLAWVIKPSTSDARRYALAAAGGALAGIGLGFRNDLLQFIPIFGVVLLALPAHGNRPLRTRGLRLAAFVFPFVVFGAPILQAYAGGSNTAHVVLLGRMTAFDRPLRIDPPTYDLGALYNDHYVWTHVRSFAQREPLAPNDFLLIGTAEYEAASSRYLLEVVRLLPADTLVRGYGAVGGVFMEPFRQSASSVGWLRGGWSRAVAFRMAVVQYLPWLAAIAGAIVLVAAVWRQPAETLPMLLIVLLLVASTALQFDPRHFFYLEFVVWWPLVALASGISRFGRFKTEAPAWRWWPLAVLLVVPLIAIVALVAARAVQTRQVRAVMDSLDRAEVEPVDISRELEDGKVRFLVPPLVEESGDTGSLAMAYHVFEFGGPACDRFEVLPILRYEGGRSFEDFSRQVRVELGDGSDRVRLFAPAFQMTDIVRVRFIGVELPVQEAECLVSLTRLREEDHPPVLLTAILPEGWSSLPLYQRLDWERRRELPARPQVVPAGVLSRREVAQTLRAPLAAEIRLADPGAVRDGQGAVFRGTVERPFGYIVASATKDVPDGALAVITGELREGGITVGLLKAGAWADRTDIRDVGPFSVVLQAQSEGPHEIVVAHNLPGPSRRNDLRLEKIGWASP